MPVMSEKAQDKSVLSPVQVYTPQHGPGNLTGHLRKVKDLAADFHNYILKWEACNAQGLEVVTEIANIKIEKVFGPKECDDSTRVPNLPEELNPLCDRLAGIIETMATLESKMSAKAQNAEALVALEKFPGPSGDTNQILFSTMTLQDVANSAKEIKCDFSQELKLKRHLLGQVAHTSSRGECQALAACWLHQPYIRPQCWDLLQALLKETGHVK